MPLTTFDNHYARLGLPFDATEDEIRRAFRDAAKRLHPDRNTSQDDTDQFLRVQESFENLSDPKKRFRYDQTLDSSATPPGIVLKTVFSRKQLLQSNEPQLLYALFEIDPLPVIADVTSTPAVNVCLVIDRSTSMQGKRLDMVKLTAIRILKQLRSGDILSIVSFSDRAEVVVPAARERDPKKTNARISLIRTGGGTELFHGLTEGAHQVQRYLRSSGVNHLILITDGHTYGDEEKCLSLADKIKDNGITISALGIGEEWNEVFLDRLASKTGGTSLYVAFARDIQEFLELKFIGLQKAYAENLRLEIANLQPEVRLQYAFRVQPDPTRLAPDSVIALGNIRLREPMVLLLEVLLKKSTLSADPRMILEGQIRCEIPVREIPTSRARFSIALPVVQENIPETPPQPIIQAMSRLTLYRMQEQVRKDLANGDTESATHRLRHLATRVLASGDHRLASTILSEARRLESDSRQTRKLEKSIMYGTKTLISKRKY